MSNWLSTIIAVTGVLTSGLLAYLAYSLNRQSQRASIHRSLGNMYEELMRFRVEHPEVMRLSSDWNDDCFHAIYHQKTKTDRFWVVYYSFAELICDFSNTVLYGWDSHSLDKCAYKNHYEPLVRLLLTEHYPFIKTTIDGPYLSTLIKKFVREEARRGWNWEQHRKDLVGIVTKK
jgi:hypothetical protein